MDDSEDEDEEGGKGGKKGELNETVRTDGSTRFRKGFVRRETDRITFILAYSKRKNTLQL